MMGLSGHLVTLDSGVLSLEDAAIGLARMPRFGGQTLGVWTVVDHLLAGMVYARRAGWSDRDELLWGLHDYHESMTADVPTTFKPESLRSIQARLDERLYVCLGLNPPTRSEEQWVKQLDKDMLLAEASIMTPPATYWRIVWELGGRQADHAHLVAVGEVLSWNKVGQEAANAWLDRIHSLMLSIREER
jgi:hypothetical protein